MERVYVGYVAILLSGSAASVVIAAAGRAAERYVIFASSRRIGRPSIWIKMAVFSRTPFGSDHFFRRLCCRGQ